MSYTLTDYSATEVELNDGLRNYYYKKCYCSVELQGEYIVFTSHKVENNAYRQSWTIAYTDFTTPTGSAATVLAAIKTIIENYAGGGTGGGGIQHATASGTDTYTASITGVTSYADGDAYLIRFTNGNTTGATLNINGLGAIDLYRNNDGLLIGGDIVAGGEALCVYNSTTNGFQCIGTAPNTLLAYVTNADSVSITKGMPVYAYGGTGDRLTVKRAYNTTDATSAQTIGVVQSTSIATGQKGLIIMQGQLDNLNIFPTSTWADGDPIYLGATAGTLTKVKPSAPNHLVYIGYVLSASPGSAGRMYVRPQNGYELKELHDVQAQSPALKDTLYYDSADSQWKTASLATILGYTPVPTTRTISTTSPLSGGGDLSADRTLSIANALADGATKGAAAFTANDFDSASGVISIDYTNGQAASSSNKGFLTSADWNTFNNKLIGFGQYRKAGRWYTNSLNAWASGGSSTNSANLIRYYPFIIDQDITISRIGVNAATAGGAGTTIRLGIYTNNSSTCTPQTRLVDSGTILVDVTGSRTMTGLSVSLTKGLYWFAYFSNATTGTLTACTPSSVIDVKGLTSIGISPTLGLTESLTYGALPTTASAAAEITGTSVLLFYYYY